MIPGKTSTRLLIVQNENLTEIEKLLIKMFSLIRTDQGLTFNKIIAICYFIEAEFKDKNLPPLKIDFLRGSEFISSNSINEVLKRFVSFNVLDKKQSYESSGFFKSPTTQYFLGVKGAMLSSKIEVGPIHTEALMAYIGYFNQMDNNSLTQKLYRQITLSNFEIGDSIPVKSVFLK